MIKNYVFDLGNVILILEWDKVLNKYNITNEEKALLKKNVFNSKEWNLLDEGTISKSDALKIMKSNLPESLHGYCVDIMETWKEGLTINNEMLELIQHIKSSGYNTYVLSNAPIEIDDFLEKKDLKKYFDGIIISAFEKKIKPNSEIYELLLDRFNLEANESLFIDDKLENIESAKVLGIDAFQFDYKNINKLKDYINIDF